MTLDLAVTAAAGQATCAACQELADRPVGAATVGGGMVLNPGAVVLFGSHLNCTRPATVSIERAGPQTEDGRTLLREGVPQGSARWRILRNGMYRQLREVAAQAARLHGTDCVVRSGDIQDAQGLPVSDLTDSVLDSLG